MVRLSVPLSVNTNPEPVSPLTVPPIVNDAVLPPPPPLPPLPPPGLKPPPPFTPLHAAITNAVPVARRAKIAFRLGIMVILFIFTLGTHDPGGSSVLAASCSFRLLVPQARCDFRADFRRAPSGLGRFRAGPTHPDLEVLEPCKASLPPRYSVGNISAQGLC